MPKVEVLVEIQGGCCQSVFVKVDGISEDDVKVGVIDWDVFDVSDVEEYQDTVGWLARPDPQETMQEETKVVGARIFEENPMTVREFIEWEKQQTPKQPRLISAPDLMKMDFGDETRQ